MQVFDYCAAFCRHHSAEREQTEPFEARSRWSRWTVLHLDRECFPQAGWPVRHMAQGCLPEGWLQVSILRACTLKVQVQCIMLVYNSDELPLHGPCFWTMWYLTKFWVIATKLIIWLFCLHVRGTLILDSSSFSLPMHKMTNTDLTRILKSEEIQKALRAPK